MSTILILSVSVLLLLAVPIGIAMGAASLITLFVQGTIPTLIVTQKLMSGINHFTMLAVTFFILAGEVMTEGGVSKKLVVLANSMVGKITGGLSMVATLSAMFSGSFISARSASPRRSWT